MGWDETCAPYSDGAPLRLAALMPPPPVPDASWTTLQAWSHCREASPSLWKTCHGSGHAWLARWCFSLPDWLPGNAAFPACLPRPCTMSLHIAPWSAYLTPVAFATKLFHHLLLPLVVPLLHSLTLRIALHSSCLPSTPSPSPRLAFIHFPASSYLPSLF